MNSKLQQAELDAIRRACAVDPVQFCKVFLGEWFRGPIPWFHRGILAILTRSVDWLDKYDEVDKILEHFTFKLDPNDTESEVVPMFRRRQDGTLSLTIGRFTQLRIPRGFAKTTLVNAVTLRNIVYKSTYVMVYTSETATHAERQLRNVRNELESNRLLRAVFGQLRPDQRSGMAWRNDEIECTNGVTVVARGSGAQIRGMMIRGRRPDCIVLDDVETREGVKNEEIRKDVREWVYKDVMPALDVDNPNATLTAIGTLLHRDAMLKRLEMDPRVSTVVFSARLPDGKWLWPEHMGAVQFEETYNAYALVGELPSFYLEYMNAERLEEGNKFQSRMIQYGSPSPEEELHTAIAIDPAISDKKKSAMSAIAVVSISSAGRIYVRDMWSKVGAHPGEQIDEYFKRVVRFKPQRCGVESIAYQAALVHFMREAMFRRGTYFEITPITHSIQKQARVEGVLATRYAAGVVWHVQRFPTYEAQLLDWPNGLLDLPDVTAMAITLLDPYAAQAADPAINLAADTYRPLDEVLSLKEAV